MTRLWWSRCWVVGLLSLAWGASVRGDSEGLLEVPAGFRVELFADDEQATNIYCVTTDQKGRIVVSGPGYIRLLEDTTGDGRADRVLPFADGPASGAQGLCVEGDSLYCIGDGGLLRYRDADGDGRADGPPELIKAFPTGGEHNTHALHRGPDGFWYLIAGNSAEIEDEDINAEFSPIVQPKAGVLMRLSPDFSTLEVLADGYRNAYDFSFNAEGDLFTYDSDGERELSLPFYRPTRVFHTVPGMNHGWVSRSWKKPDYFPEMSPALVNLGRGSPTGVLVYRHHQFPEEFHNALFVLDWTYGRVMAIRTKRKGASWGVSSKVFARGRGNYGFAPTSATVGPDGSLYVAVGGRGTQGSLFRISATAENDSPESGPPSSAEPPADPPRSRLLRLKLVLNAPQPEAAWSRAKWVPMAREVGAEAFLIAGLDKRRDVSERLRAIEILTELFGGPDIDFMTSLAFEPERELRARSVWAYGRTSGSEPDPHVLKGALRDNSPLVRRQALETLLISSPRTLGELVTEIAECLGSEDHVVRQLAVRVAARMENSHFRELGEIARTAGWAEALQMARAFVDRGYVGHPYAWRDIGLQAIRRHEDSDVLLTATLLMQHAWGGFGPSPLHPPVFDGYLPRVPIQIEEEEMTALVKELELLYPTGEAILDRELSRLIAMLSPTSSRLLDQLLTRINEQSLPVSDLHYLICVACLPVERSEDQSARITDVLLSLFEKMQAANMVIDRNWEPRVGELVQQLITYDPTLPQQLIADPRFGEPAHAFLISTMPKETARLALDRYLERITRGQLELTPDLLGLFSGHLNDSVLALARKSLEEETLQAAAVLLLAEANREEDRQQLLRGLSSSHWQVVTACLRAQQAWEEPTPETLAALIGLLERLARERELVGLGDDVLKEVRRRAESLTEGEKSADLPPSSVFALVDTHAEREAIAAAWVKWFRSTFPDLEWKSSLSTGEGPWQEWEERFQALDLSQGDANRGAAVYERLQCAQCHQGRTAIGPSLEGIASRFSPRDLMIAVVDPNRDVSPRYRTSLITTQQGKTYTGMIIYESSDGLLLRDSTQRTIRIETSDIEFRRELATSLMPENLLKQASDADITDLFAYLRTLNTTRK